MDFEKFRGKVNSIYNDTIKEFYQARDNVITVARGNDVIEQVPNKNKKVEESIR